MFDIKKPAAKSIAKLVRHWFLISTFKGSSPFTGTLKPLNEPGNLKKEKIEKL